MKLIIFYSFKNLKIRNKLKNWEFKISAFKSTQKIQKYKITNLGWISFSQRPSRSTSYSSKAVRSEGFPHRELFGFHSDWMTEVQVSRASALHLSSRPKVPWPCSLYLKQLVPSSKVWVFQSKCFRCSSCWNLLVRGQGIGLRVGGGFCWHTSCSSRFVLLSLGWGFRWGLSSRRCYHRKSG